MIHRFFKERTDGLLVVIDSNVSLVSFFFCLPFCKRSFRAWKNNVRFCSENEMMHRFFLKGNGVYFIVDPSHFPHSAPFRTLPHSLFSTLLIFHTPHFSHCAPFHTPFSILRTQRFPPNHNNCKQLRQFIPLPDHYFTVCVLRHIEACIGYQSLMKGVNGDQLLRQTFHVVFLSLSFVHAWSCVFKYS